MARVPPGAGILIVLGITAGPGLLKADDDESPLGKIMEKVNKHNSTITKGTRTKVAYAKDQKKVEESTKALAKLGKDAKPNERRDCQGQDRGPTEEVGRLHGRIHHSAPRNLET